MQELSPPQRTAPQLSDDALDLVPRLHNRLVRRRLLTHALAPAMPRERVDAALRRADPTVSAVRIDLHHIATALQAAGRADLALAAMRRVLADVPQDAWARCLAVDYAHRLGRRDEERALAHGFDLGAIAPTMMPDVGNALLRAGLSARAAEAFDRAQRLLRDTDPGPHGGATMARGLTATGRPADAVAWWTRVTGREPDRVPRSRPAIIDPGHTDGAGHHINATRFAASVVAELTGMPPVVVVHHAAAAASLGGMEVARAMTVEPYVFTAYALGSAEYDALDEAFAHDLTTLYGRSRPPILLIHSLRHTMLGGLASWLCATNAGSPSVVVAGMIEADHVARGLAPGASLLTKTRSLAPRRDVRMVLYAETEAGVDWLARAAPGIHVHRFPYVAAARLRPLRRPRDPQSTPRFGMVGATRAERGFGPLFRALLARGPLAADVLVQVAPEALGEFDDGASDALAALRARGDPRLALLSGVLDVAAYDDAVAALDCVVLPYRGRYAVSGSGVLFEAIEAGATALVPHGSTLASALDRLAYPHGLIDPNDPDGLRAAMEDVVARWPSIAAQLAAFHARGLELPADRFLATVRHALADVGLLR